MSGFARLLANIMVMGGGVVGRAFLDAYKQALQNGGKASARAGLRGGGVTAQEARQILNVNPKATPAEIEESCAFLLSANDPAKGGSSYVQSKIRNARAALIVEEPPATAGAAGGGSAAAGQKAPDSK